MMFSKGQKKYGHVHVVYDWRARGVAKYDSAEMVSCRGNFCLCPGDNESCILCRHMIAR